MELMTDKIIQPRTGDHGLNIMNALQKIILSAAVQFRQNIIQKQDRRIFYFSLHNVYF